MMKQKRVTMIIKKIQMMRSSSNEEFLSVLPHDILSSCLYSINHLHYKIILKKKHHPKINSRSDRNKVVFVFNLFRHNALLAKFWLSGENQAKRKNLTVFIIAKGLLLFNLFYFNMAE